MSLLFLTPQWLSICPRIKAKRVIPCSTWPCYNVSDSVSHYCPSVTSLQPHWPPAILKHARPFCHRPLSWPFPLPAAFLHILQGLVWYRLRQALLQALLAPLRALIALCDRIQLFPSTVLTSLYHDKIYSYILIAYDISLLQDYKLHEDRIAFFFLLMYLHIEQCLTHNRCSINICLIHWDHLRSRLRMNA